MASCPRLQQLLMLACLISLALTLTPETNIPVQRAGVYLGRFYTRENKIHDGDWTTCSVHSGKTWDITFGNSTVSWVRAVGTSWKALPNMTVAYPQLGRREQVYGSSYVLDWVNVGGVTTRYVRLRFSSPVALCEVEIYKGPMLNVALGKPASQSSTFDGMDTYQAPYLTYRASADLAVDGAPTKAYSDKTCAMTDWLRGPTDYPWWQVDLGDLYIIFLVNIYGRGEGESDKPNYGPLIVRVGSHVERPENRTSYTDRPLVSVPLSPPVTASSVNISIDNTYTIFTLCEVEVYAIQYCPDNKYGPNCSKECSETCQNKACNAFNGSCLLGCDPGYTGSNCTTDVDECKSDPCKNGATCRDEVNRFSCTCPPGYQGNECQTDIDECHSAPCQHSGTCHDDVSSYTCTCQPGYTGVMCQTDIDECVSSPCHNGGHCTDGVNSYTCTCLPGYTGVTCDTDIDECASQPCRFGLCDNKENSYTCVCLSGFSGTNCDESEICHSEVSAPSEDGSRKDLGMGLGTGLGMLLLLLILIFFKRRNASPSGSVPSPAIQMTSRNRANATDSKNENEAVAAENEDVHGHPHAVEDEAVYEKVNDYEMLEGDSYTKYELPRGLYENLETS